MTTDLSPDGPVAYFDELMIDLAERRKNAALRKKPTMWAYYGTVRTFLAEYFSDVQRTDGSFAGAALALSQRAERKCPKLPDEEAARLWAVGVYARRILAAWGAGAGGRGPGGRVSLQWLRKRAA